MPRVEVLMSVRLCAIVEQEAVTQLEGNPCDRGRQEPAALGLARVGLS